MLKPTLTSSTKRKYKPEDFPEILLCPEPSIDIQALKSLGYTSKESYQAGFDDNEFSSQFLGWTGNNSESVEEVIKKISVLKAAEDCAIEGKSKIWYTTKEKEEGVSENIKFKLKHALYPHHLCCELITPKAASHHHIAAISLRFSFLNKSFGSFEIFFGDKLNSFFSLHKTRILGDKIIAKSDSNGYLNFIIEIEEDQHIEDDPNYSCTDYKIEGEYHKCLENEYVTKMLNLLNCTPPWLTENKDFWCSEGKQFDMSHLAEYMKFYYDVSLSAADSEKCLTPCTSKQYFSKRIGLAESEDLIGIDLILARDVKVTKSEFQIGFKTLITRFGGIIGISKNLLWIVILVFSSFGFLCHRASKKANSEIQEEQESNDR